MLTFRVKSFSALTTEELYALLQLRSEVFVVEQNCVYQDVDGNDFKAVHVLGYLEKKLVAYTRIFDAGAYYNTISFGRVIISQSARGLGYGHQLLQFTLDTINKQFSKSTITISAQQYLKSFYEGYGFTQQGEAYLEDGIPHIEMTTS